MKYYLIIFAILFVGPLSAQSTNEYILKGNEFYRQGKFEEAVKQYDAALKTSPGDATAKFNRASATYRLNKEPEAIKAYEEVIAEEQVVDRKAKAYYNKGSILSKQNKLEESIEVYKNALRNDPSDTEARENLQKALLELKKKQPPKKKEEEKKKKENKQQQQKQKPQPKLNQKEAEQRLKLLEQKEKEVQQRMQKQKASGGGSQNKDW